MSGPFSAGVQEKSWCVYFLVLRAYVFRPERSPDLLALDEALTKLSQLDSRKSQIVELRFFGGLHEVETALVVGVSERTVRSEWKLAKAWLYREITSG